MVGSMQEYGRLQSQNLLQGSCLAPGDSASPEEPKRWDGYGYPGSVITLFLSLFPAGLQKGLFHRLPNRGIQIEVCELLDVALCRPRSGNDGIPGQTQRQADRQAVIGPKVPQAAKSGE